MKSCAKRDVRLKRLPNVKRLVGAFFPHRFFFAGKRALNPSAYQVVSASCAYGAGGPVHGCQHPSRLAVHVTGVSSVGSNFSQVSVAKWRTGVALLNQNITGCTAQYSFITPVGKLGLAAVKTLQTLDITCMQVR